MTEAEKEEKEKAKKDKIRKFESPVPFVLILRNVIFGKKKPDIYTRITFLINLIICLAFLVWSGISYFAIISKDWIWNQKGIPVSSIIENRGTELGFETGVFISRLEMMNLISIVCWIVFFFGLVLLYRKKKQFVYFTLIPVGIYLILNTLYLSFTYFINDTTMFDKISLLVVVLSLGIHSYLINNERQGGSISFFGEAEDLDDVDIPE
jgi:energy-converting hydrogenase Eha subunit C